jgi:hypothetical protein
MGALARWAEATEGLSASKERLCAADLNSGREEDPNSG